MIQKLKYHEIDFVKYCSCLEKSEQQNFYAQKEILDFLCEDWELLTFNGYEAVMPVPIKKKWGFRVVVMPLFCQQLGIFSKKDDEQINLLLLDFLKKKYRILNYAFNHHNRLPDTIPLKKNYVVAKTEYPTLRKNYFKGRKSTVKTARFHEYRELDFDEDAKKFVKSHYKGLERVSDAEKFFSFLDFLNTKKILKIFGSYNKEALTSLTLLIEQPESLSLLGLINNKEFRNDNGASFLIDRILQENIAHKNFDFMGGNIRGIEVFFKSFGAGLQEYPFIGNSKKDLMISFFLKN